VSRGLEARDKNYRRSLPDDIPKLRPCFVVHFSLQLNIMKTLQLFSTLAIIVHACDHHHPHDHHGKHDADTLGGWGHPTVGDSLWHSGVPLNSTLTPRQQRRALFLQNRSKPLQGRCGSSGPTEDEVVQSMKVVSNWAAAHGGSEGIVAGGATATATVKTVKVWWHVMKRAKTGKLNGAWSRTLAEEGIDYLNYFFSNTSFYFELAGMTQTVNKRWWNCADDDTGKNT
jgi:hypothetical protein